MKPAPGPRAVLLTGVTGSLGGYLCAELLARTRATAYCLARGSAQRAEERLAALGVTPAERLVHVPGDITRTRLGLAPAAYDALAESVDEVLHCAAQVDFAAEYDLLAPVNVGGTRHIIAFAEHAARLTGRAVPIRYISTLGTLCAARAAGLTEVDENTPATPTTAGQLGYTRTKATAERDLHAAEDRGVPLTLFRPGVVTGHSTTGRTGTSDLLVPILSASAALGRVPEGVGVIPMDAVDVVARSLIQLCRLPDAAGQTYHLIHPEPVPLTDVFEAMRRAGYRLETTEADAWWSHVDDHATDPWVRSQAVLRDLTRYCMITGPEYLVPRTLADRTWKTLTEAAVPRPPLDAAYLDRLVHSLTVTEALPPPSADISAGSSTELPSA
ncbi:SDR family oxidoreductase [Streptomyces sp. NPDC059788]|uniref:SDR family oxidoreductase n=1 Tax=Streptomyces sp. NPDC059788 TaxID=3346948 RepID=UPI00366479CD